MVRKSRLGWFGHLERKDAGDWVSACRNMAVVGNVGKGRLKTSWNEVLKDDLKKCSLNRGLAKDRESWKEGSSYGENVRPVRARTRNVKREEREIISKALRLDSHSSSGDGTEPWTQPVWSSIRLIVRLGCQ